MRFVYTLIFYLCLPLVLVRLLWRARRAPDYARRWSERFGFVDPRPPERPAIWVHAVSVGETLAALPLIRQLQLHYPTHELLVTTTTPTGSERVKSALGDSVRHVYGPYDLPDCVSRFLRRMRPSLAIIMETELWPNIIAACHARGVGLVVANARLSEKSARGYARFGRLTRDMLERVTLIAAQSDSDARRFVELGAATEKVSVTGNIKFDLDVDPQQIALAEQYRQRWQAGGNRAVLIAASTHAGEDELLLEGFSRVLQQLPDVLLVLVPRHPERFELVRQLADKRFAVQRHSEGQPVAASTQVLVGDSMGELMALLGASDLVFMGGTWVDNGGHNFIEPASWGKPVLCGPSLFNFAEVSRLLLDAGAMQMVSDPQEFADQACRLLQDRAAANRMGAAGKRIADSNRGALQKLMLHCATLLRV